MFSIKQGNCLIAQSGGPTAVINSSLIGILDEIEQQNFKGRVYGSVAGLQGLITGEYIELTNITKQKRAVLRKTPGSTLGTCRHRVTNNEIDSILTLFKKNNIKLFFYIGGNGSMQVAKLISDAAKACQMDLIVIGVPKSIDNDLYGTDYSPGYGSAAKFLAISLLDMQMDVLSYPNRNRITIIETMGRNTGWLAAACSLVQDSEQNKTFIYIPESPFDLNKCINNIESATKSNKNSFIVVSEGVRDKAGKLLNEASLTYDALGRPRLGGVSAFLEEKISHLTDLHVRSIAPSIWQRSSVLLASKIDIDEAYNVGKAAFKFALEGNTDKMVGIVRLESTPYKVKYELQDLDVVAEREKTVPIEWYNERDASMREGFLDYLRPLVQGDLSIETKDGLPLYGAIL